MFLGSTGARSKVLWVQLALAVSALSALTACDSLKLMAANVPATFGSYEVRHDLKYGSAARRESDRQTLDIYRPKRGDESYPIVIFVHGGGWTSGSKDDYRFVAEALTSRGFAVVVPNYRLYPEAGFPAFVEDIAQAVAWTRAHAADFGGDARRLFIMGHSAGAQIAALVAYDARYLQSLGGSRNWLQGFIGLAGPYDFLPFKEDYLRDVFGPESQFAASQPVNFVDANAPPALLIHGEADRVVWPYNSKSLAARLRQKNVAVFEHYYDGLDHADVLAALSVYFRGRRPLLDEIEAFARADTPKTTAGSAVATTH